MIRYRLACHKKHEFEAWFPSSDGFDKQRAAGLVDCPRCGSTKVEKTLMAPGVITSRRKAARPKRSDEAAAPAAAPAPDATQPGPVLNVPQREVLRKLKALRDKILAESDYVGPRFADEARRIHNEEAPARGIYGEANREEIEDLANDGIDVLPIPVLPEDNN